MFPPSLLNRPFLPIVTDRLTLRPLRAEDAAPMAALANDVRVAEKLTRLPHPYGLKDAEDFIPYAQEGVQKGTHLVLAVTRRSDETFMGVIGLEGTLGYWLGYPFWRQGYGKEAARAFINFCFTFLRQGEITAYALDENIPSRRVLEGIGFQKTETKVLTSFAYKGPKPVLTFTLTRTGFGENLLVRPCPTLWAVGAALVNEKGEFLLTQRLPHKGLAGVWELPGGKIELGEGPEEALIREMKEELGITVQEEDLEPLSFAPYRYETFHLMMPFYLCQHWKGTPEGIEGQKLSWVRYEDLAQIDTPPGGILVAHRLGDMLKEKGLG